MTIRNPSGLKQEAAAALSQCSAQGKIVAVYTAGLLGLSLVMTLADLLLSHLISGTGGLGNLGTHTVLATLQSMLPIVQMLMMLGWNAGYILAAVKLLRREGPDHRVLLEGYSLFWPLLRSMLIEGLIYFSLTMLSFYTAMMLYMMSPWSNALVALMEPVLPDVLSAQVPVLPDALVMSMMEAMVPMLLIFAVLYFVLALPVSYRLRMSLYCLIDAPRAGAINALRTSRRIMRGNCLALFRLDLSFWWYHGILALAGLIQMLPLLGLPLPMSFDAQYYLCYGVYMAIVGGLYLLARNRVETTYAAAYDSLREKPRQNEVVLGNIFQM